MWDFKSLKHELEQAGFINIRECRYGDTPVFAGIEDPIRYEYNALAVECVKD
jgi:hypothetical protein